MIPLADNCKQGQDRMPQKMPRKGPKPCQETHLAIQFRGGVGCSGCTWLAERASAEKTTRQSETACYEISGPVPSEYARLHASFFFASGSMLAACWQRSANACVENILCTLKFLSKTAGQIMEDA